MSNNDHPDSVGKRTNGLSRLEFLRMAGVGAGIAALSGPLASCSRFVGGAGGGGSVQLMTESSYRDALEAVLAMYREQNSGFEVDTSYVTTEQLMNTLRTQLASENAPDVLHTWPGTGGNAMALGEVGPLGYLVDLSDQAWPEKVPERTRSLLQYDGKTMMYSPGLAVIGTMYYKPIFEDLDLDIPQTWDQLLAACETIKDAGKVPFAVGNKEPVFTQFMSYALVPSTVYADTPNFAEDHLAGKANFADSGWEEAFKKYLELEERGYFNQNSLGTSPQEATQMLFSGEAAMLVTPVVGLPQLEEQYDAQGKVGVFALPGSSEPENVWIPAAPSSGWGAYAQSEQVGVVKDLIGFFGELEVVNMFAEKLSLLPVIPNDQASVPAALESMVAFIEDGKYAAFPDQRWPSADVQQTHFAVVQQMFTGEISVEEALKRMDETFERGLKDANGE